MKYTYEYTKYKDFPEATEISKSREGSRFHLFGLDALLFIASVICLIVDFRGSWQMIFLLAISIGWFIYLVKYYDKVTEIKIQKAIRKRIEMMEDIASSTYRCKFVHVLGESMVGKCKICPAENSNLTLCKIKNDMGTRSIYVCSDCIRKFQSGCIK